MRKSACLFIIGLALHGSLGWGKGQPDESCSGDDCKRDAGARRVAGTGDSDTSTRPEGNSEPVATLAGQLTTGGLTPTQLMESSELANLDDQGLSSLIDEIDKKITESTDSEEKAQLEEARARVLAKKEGWEDKDPEKLRDQRRKIIESTYGDKSAEPRQTAELKVLKEFEEKQRAQQGLTRALADKKAQLVTAKTDTERSLIQSQIRTLETRLALGEFRASGDATGLAGKYSLKADGERAGSDKLLPGHTIAGKQIYERPDGTKYADMKDGSALVLPKGAQVWQTKSADSVTSSVSTVSAGANAPVATGDLIQVDGKWAPKYKLPNGDVGHVGSNDKFMVNDGPPNADGSQRLKAIALPQGYTATPQHRLVAAAVAAEPAALDTAIPDRDSAPRAMAAPVPAGESGVWTKKNEAAERAQRKANQLTEKAVREAEERRTQIPAEKAASTLPDPTPDQIATLAEKHDTALFGVGKDDATAFYLHLRGLGYSDDKAYNWALEAMKRRARNPDGVTITKPSSRGTASTRW